jgi:hypothetical protein
MKLKNLIGICLLFISGNLLAQNPNVDAKVFGKGSLKKSNKVYIADLKIAQYIQTSASQTAGGGGAYAKMSVNFGGVDGAAYQTMLEEVYKEISEKFKSLGYEVITNDEVKSKREEAVMFQAPGEPEKMVSGTVTGSVIRPSNVLLSPAKSSIVGTFFNKVAKSVDAHTFHFNYNVNTVSFDRGSKMSKKASVAGEPALWIDGYTGAVSNDARGGATIYLKPFGTSDLSWVGEGGISETSSNKKPWMGSSMGKYTLEVKQSEYLAALKNLLVTASNQTIDAFHAELK